MTGRWARHEQPLSLRLAAISADPLAGLDLTRRPVAERHAPECGTCLHPLDGDHCRICGTVTR